MHGQMHGFREQSDRHRGAPPSQLALGLVALGVMDGCTTEWRAYGKGTGGQGAQGIIAGAQECREVGSSWAVQSASEGF